MPHTAIIAIGGNLGDVRSNIEKAFRLLGKSFTIEKVSSLYKTAPVGGPPDQPDFLNGAAIISTSMTPGDTMEILLNIERKLGRVRDEKWGPRIIDLDLIDQAGVLIDEPSLKLPHPRLQNRIFVLEPLNEIAPDWRHPVTGKSPMEMIGLLSQSDRAVILGKEGPP